jgi:hypothetical protein
MAGQDRGEIPTIRNTYYDQAATAHARQQQLGNQWLKQQLRDSLAMEEAKKPMQIDTRLVKVFIVDPTESLELNDRLLYKSDEFLTDRTDQELFFEIGIKDILDRHNEKRIKTRDKMVKSHDGSITYLEPTRVRDLKMQVVTLAGF